MARIEQLVDLVADDALRQEIAAEVATLKRRQQFGLLFERHIPETTLLLNAPIRVGSTVVKRRDSKDTPLRVLEVRGEELVVAPIPAGETRAPRRGHAAPGEPEIVDCTDVLVRKTFGETVYPALTSVGRVERGGDKPFHAVIEGENYHALDLFGFSLEGQVDVIYLDPPYNTGAHDWTYNNAYVDDNDSWQHSKWLSFMEKRLRLARRLLRPDGVMVVTIDEHEVHHLGMLLDQVFPDARRQMVAIVTNPTGQNRVGGLARVDEQAFFLFFGNAPAPVGHGDDFLSEQPRGSAGNVVRWERLIRGGPSSGRAGHPGTFYPVLIDEDAQRVLGVGELLLEGEPDLSAKVNGHTAAWPMRGDGSNGRWRIGPAKLQRLIEQGYVKLGGYDRTRNTWTILYIADSTAALIERGAIRVVGRDDNGVVRLERAEDRPVSVKTIWNRGRHAAGVYGSALLASFLGERNLFTFPKSLYAVRDTLDILVHDRPDALILDAFAGSGTTLHATMLLNAEDGGRRRCLLVTNNEVGEDLARHLNRSGHFRGDPEFDRHGIFEAVTRPRVSAAVTGRRPNGAPVDGTYLDGSEYADGLEENVEYLRVDYLDPAELELGRRFDELLPTLWLSAGSRGKREGIDRAADFSVAADGPYAFLARPSGVEGLLAALDGRQDVTHVFVLTDSEDAFSELTEQLPATLTVRMLPRDYLRSFKNGRESAG